MDRSADQEVDRSVHPSVHFLHQLVGCGLLVSHTALDTCVLFGAVRSRWLLCVHLVPHRAQGAGSVYC